jgi:hypothetical protein
MRACKPETAAVHQHAPMVRVRVHLRVTSARLSNRLWADAAPPPASNAPSAPTDPLLPPAPAPTPLEAEPGVTAGVELPCMGERCTGPSSSTASMHFSVYLGQTVINHSMSWTTVQVACMWRATQCTSLRSERVEVLAGQQFWLRDGLSRHSHSLAKADGNVVEGL